MASPRNRHPPSYPPTTSPISPLSPLTPPSPPLYPSTQRPRVVRLLLRLLNLLLLTVALYLVPTAIHHLVAALSALSSLTGRRARTPFEDIPTARVVLGVGVLAVWHAVLGGVSWYAVRRGGSRVVVVGWLGGGFLMGVVGVGRALGG